MENLILKEKKLGKLLTQTLIAQIEKYVRNNGAKLLILDINENNNVIKNDSENVLGM